MNNIPKSPCYDCSQTFCMSKDCYRFEKWFLAAWEETRLLLMKQIYSNEW